MGISLLPPFRAFLSDRLDRRFRPYASVCGPHLPRLPRENRENLALRTGIEQGQIRDRSERDQRPKSAEQALLLDPACGHARFHQTRQRQARRLPTFKDPLLQIGSQEGEPDQLALIAIPQRSFAVTDDRTGCTFPTECFGQAMRLAQTSNEHGIRPMPRGG